MDSALHATNKLDLIENDALANDLHEYLRHRAVIEQDLRRVGITDTTPLELADRIIADAMHSAYACMLSAHKLAHAGIAKGENTIIGDKVMAKPSHCKGELLALSSGGATHYQCSGLYRALVDFNLGELAEQYCLQAPYRLATLDRLNTGIVSIEDINQMEASGAYAHRDISDVGFGQYLIHRGYLQLVMINEVHCGVGFSPDIVRESANVRAQTLSQLSGGHA